MRVAAAVEADVQNDRFLVEIVGIQRPHETVQSRLVHASDVDVAEFALAKLGDPLRRSGRPSDRTSVVRMLAAARRLAASTLPRGLGSAGIASPAGHHLVDLVVEGQAMSSAAGQRHAVDRQ